MSIQIDRALEATLRFRAAARGISVQVLVEELVNNDERQTPTTESATGRISEALRLDHEPGVDNRYYGNLELDPEIESRLFALADAGRIGIDDYLKRRLEVTL